MPKITPKKSPSPMDPIFARVPKEIEDRIDAAAKRRSAARGVQVSTSDTIRELLVMALDTDEKDSRKYR